MSEYLNIILILYYLNIILINFITTSLNNIQFFNYKNTIKYLNNSFFFDIFFNLYLNKKKYKFLFL